MKCCFDIGIFNNIEKDSCCDIVDKLYNAMRVVKIESDILKSLNDDLKMFDLDEMQSKAKENLKLSNENITCRLLLSSVYVGMENHIDQNINRFSYSDFYHNGLSVWEISGTLQNPLMLVAQNIAFNDDDIYHYQCIKQLKYLLTQVNKNFQFWNEATNIYKKYIWKVPLSLAILHIEQIPSRICKESSGSDNCDCYFLDGRKLDSLLTIEKYGNELMKNIANTVIDQTKDRIKSIISAICEKIDSTEIDIFEAVEVDRREPFLNDEQPQQFQTVNSAVQPPPENDLSVYAVNLTLNNSMPQHNDRIQYSNYRKTKAGKKRGRKPKIIVGVNGNTTSNLELRYISEHNANVCINWIRSALEKANNWDPPLLREYIYSLYANYCDTYNHYKINIAFFGKCLRKVFPNVRSRRLLVSGHILKYHYVDIKVKPITIINEI